MAKVNIVYISATSLEFGARIISFLTTRLIKCVYSEDAGSGDVAGRKKTWNELVFGQNMTISARNIAGNVTARL